MAVTLQSLLENTSDLYRLKVIAGKVGLSRPVSWVYYTEDSSTIKFIRGSELAITTGMNIVRHASNTGDDSPEFVSNYLYDLIEKLNEMEAAGIIINTGCYINRIPDEIMRLCDRLDFPLISMPWEIHMIDIMQDYGNRIVNARQKGHSLEQSLYTAMFHPEKFEPSMLEETSFSSASKYGVILLEIPENFFDKDDDKIRRYMEYSFNSRLDVPPSSFCWFIHENKIVYVVRDNPKETAGRINSACAHDRFLSAMKISASGTCRSPLSLGDEYRHAELAMSFCTNNSGSVSFYNTLGIYKILAEVKNRSVLENMYEEILGKLNILSPEKRDDYLNTLRLYLEAGGNVNKTAEENSTHRNTVNYRIKKIMEILGSDLQNGQTRYEIQTALYIRELLSHYS